MASTSKTMVARTRRRARIRKKVKGTADCPRLAFFRSNHHLYAQIIDDTSGRTLVSASTVQKSLRGTPDTKEGGEKVGKALAESAKAKGIERVVFDRGGFQFHGVARSLADAARKAGLKF